MYMCVYLKQCIHKNVYMCVHAHIYMYILFHIFFMMVYHRIGLPRWYLW